MRYPRPIFLTIGILAAGTFGCSEWVQREYVYTRREPTAGRKSPTVFVVRLRIDRSAKQVVWFQDVHDSDGALGRHTTTYTGCTFLDDSNWECEPLLVVDGQVAERVEMRDGQLRQQYWNEDRTFETRRRVGRAAF